MTAKPFVDTNVLIYGCMTAEPFVDTNVLIYGCMTAEPFVDTNVLIYGYDKTAGSRHQAAASLLRCL